jgi:two-component system CheB/CheR fusion protein
VANEKRPAGPSGNGSGDDDKSSPSSDATGQFGPGTQNGDAADQPTAPAGTAAGASAGVRAGLVPQIVGIGASAGGLDAFTRLVGHLAADTGLAYVLVQHLDPHHESRLPELLGRATSVAVVQATDGMKIEADHAYVIPPNATMTVTDGHLRVVERAHTSSPHLSIDAFLCSLAEVHGAGAVGVILSGAGSDGARGIEAIKLEGGITMAQAPESAGYPSMPKSAVETGYVDFVLTPEEIAAQLTKLGRHVNKSLGSQPQRSRATAGTAEEMTKILLAVKSRTGVDFRQYRPGTVERRILRRMLLHRHDSHESYLEYLRANPEEIDELYDDLLIGVTSFFRDPEAFAVLQRDYFPKMLADRPTERPLRVWVAGCAGGEETYSVAIALLESLGDEAADTAIQIFATDLSDKAITRARAGLYPEGIEATVSAERLRRFFVREDGGYRIRKAVRDLCIFSRHDIVRDPPFAHLDLVTCRNVLIYLEPTAQQRVFPIFHYALDPNGVLLLGSAESIGTASELFVPLDKRHRIFGRRSTPPQLLSLELTVPTVATGRPGRVALVAESPLGEIQNEVDRLIVGRYGPPGVVVNDRLEVLQFQGRTTDFLEHPPGTASLNLLGLVRAELATKIRALVQAARISDQKESQSDIEIGNGETARRVSVDVIPFHIQSSASQYFLVTIRHTTDAPIAEEAMPVVSPGAPEPRPERQLRELRAELSALQRYVHVMTEEHEAMNEELRSANEEVLSSNEELQSTNEELETTKEEIQATNEELSTVNEELRHRNRELSALSNDLANVLAGTQIPIVIVGGDLRLRRLTPAANRVMKVIPSDVGRPLGDVKLRMAIEDLEDRVTHTITSLEVQTLDARDDEGHWWELTIRPYQTADRRVDGAVLVFSDVDASKQYGARMEETSEVRRQLLVSSESARVNAEAAKIAAEVANEAKSRFLTSMSHDLRTPLNAIAGYTDLMDLGIRGPVSSEQRADFVRIKHSTRHLLSLINDILNFAKLEAGQVDFRLVDIPLEPLIADVSEMMVLQFRAKSINVEIGPCSTVVRADPERVRQILVNLLTNAAKFTPPGGRVRIACTDTQDTVTLEVSDTGIGISPESLERIFEPFVQVDRSLTSLDRDGVGLGLAISRDLARHMRGDLTVTSALGHGSSFLMTLPRAIQPARPSADQTAPS